MNVGASQQIPRSWKLLVAGFALLLASCSSMTSTPSVSIGASQSIAILPLANLSTTPLAGEQVSTIAETALRSRGVSNLATYIPPQATGLSALLATSSSDQTANTWARTAGYDLALSGTVHEWHYKSGPDREPSVAVSLRLTELDSGRVVWQATSAKAGWGFASLSTVGQKLVKKLLARVRVQSGL